MIELRDPTDCCGCGACRQACPSGCISLQPDAEGFCYPRIETERCIGCGACERVCPLRSNAPRPMPPSAFAVLAQDPALRESGSSGGVFAVLAQEMLRQGGTVFGAAVQPDGRVAHIGVSREEELPALFGSKYVQSDTRSCFAEARTLLEQSRPVLFSGTPCQLYGLHTFLARDYAALLTVDTVCLGVPSPGLWDRYRREREALAGGRMTAVSFRHKGSFGWKNYALRMEFDRGEPYVCAHPQDPYLGCFGRLLSLRPSCHACPFKGQIRRSDLTLGDYWGISTLFADLDDDRGVSLVLTNTPRGQEWLSRVKDRLTLREAPMEHAVKTHPSLVRALPAHSRRTEFFTACARSPELLPVLRRFAAPSPGERLRHAAGALARRLGLRRS